MDHLRTSGPAALAAPDTSGAGPRDGDFARLLEAASSPAAHRMQVDDALREVGVVARGAGGARRRAPFGPPGMIRDTTRSADHGAAGHAEAAQAASGHVASGRVGAPPSPRAAAAGTDRPARRLRDRVVSIAFALAAFWIVLSVASSLLHSPGDDLGALLLLGVAAFIVMRAWSRASARARRPEGP
jgi:hypothetical protein